MNFKWTFVVLIFIVIWFAYLTTGRYFEDAWNPVNLLFIDTYVSGNLEELQQRDSSHT